LPEIKYGSISSLNSKLVTKLLSPKELAEVYIESPGIVMSFINEFQTRASKETIFKAVNILCVLSTVKPAVYD
jgi:hypothetical protein